MTEDSSGQTDLVDNSSAVSTVGQDRNEASISSSPETFRPEDLIPIADQAMATVHGTVLKTNNPDILIARLKKLIEEFPNKYGALHPRRSQVYTTYETEVWLLKRKVNPNDNADAKATD